MYYQSRFRRPVYFKSIGMSSYELNNMSVFDYHPSNGRQFLATKTKVKVK